MHDDQRRRRADERADRRARSDVCPLQRLWLLWLSVRDGIARARADRASERRADFGADRRADRAPHRYARTADPDSATPTTAPTYPPVVLYAPTTSVQVGGYLYIGISQGSYKSGFQASSTNIGVATVSVKGNMITLHAISPGTVTINVVGNGGQTATLHAKF
jgi:hypothetical protein